MIRPIREIILERNKHVEKIIKEIIDSKEKIEELHRLIEEHKWNVIKEASSINKNLEITGKEEAARILDSIRQEIMEIKEKTDQEIRLKIQEARKMLNRESESLATAIMEKILKRRVLS
jgi:F0F1-type ATP synthase membrane subunit b/b'